MLTCLLVNDTQVLTRVPASHIGQCPALPGLNHSQAGGGALSVSLLTSPAETMANYMDDGVFGVVTPGPDCLQTPEVL